MNYFLPRRSYLYRVIERVTALYLPMICIVFFCASAGVSAGICTISERKSRTITSRDDYSHGISLQNDQTSGVFAGKKPVGGSVALNGGTLRLAADMTLKRKTRFESGGFIDGGDHQLILPYQTDPFMLPSQQSYADIRQAHSYDHGERIGAAAWGCLQRDEGDFYATGSYYKSDGLLQIFSSLDGKRSEQARTNLPAGVRALVWEPGSLSGLIGYGSYHSNGTPRVTLEYFQYDPHSQSLSRHPVGERTEAVSVIRWSANGGYAAVAYHDSSDQLVLIKRSNTGELKQTCSVSSLSSDTPIYDCAWDQHGNYLAVGTHAHGDLPQIFIYKRIGDRLVLGGSCMIPEGLHVSSLVWDGDGSNCITVGLVGTGVHSFLRRYQFYPRTARIVERERYPVRRPVYDLEWNRGNTLLAIASNSDEREGEVTLYQREGDKLVRRSSWPHEKSHYMLSWTPNGKKLHAIDSFGHITLYEIGAHLDLKNLSVVSNSPLFFQAACSVTGAVSFFTNRHALGWGVREPLTIGERATCHIFDGSLSCIPGTVIQGDRTGRLILDRVDLQSDGLSSRVPVILKGAVTLGGKIAAPLQAENATTIRLRDDTELSGSLHVTGTVTIEGGGKRIDLSNTRLNIAPESSLVLSHTEVIGLEKPGVIACQSGSSSIAFQASIGNIESDFMLTKGEITIDPLTKLVCGDLIITGKKIVYTGGTARSFLTDIAQGESGDKSSAQPVSLPYSGDGQSVTLDSDLTISEREPLIITTNTTIHGRGHTIRCSRVKKPSLIIAAGVTVLFEECVFENLTSAHLACGLASTLVWGEGTVLLIGGDGAFANPWHIRGNVTIEGANAQLVCEPSGRFVLERDAHLTLHNLTLRGLTNDTFELLDKSSEVLFSGSSLFLSEDIFWNRGRCRFASHAYMRGAHRFFYTSTEESSVERGGTLSLKEGAVFVYDPPVSGAGADKLFRLDEHATLHMSGGGLVGAGPGLTLTQGRVHLERAVLLSGQKAPLVFESKPGRTSVSICVEPGADIHRYGTVTIDLTQSDRPFKTDY